MLLFTAQYNITAKYLNKQHTK